MNSRNNVLGVIFLVAVLAFALFVAKRVLFQNGSKGGIAPALQLGARKPVTTPALPKPSAAVQTPSSPAPSSNAQAQQSTPAANGTTAGAAKVPSPAARGNTTTT